MELPPSGTSLTLGVEPDAEPTTPPFVTPRDTDEAEKPATTPTEPAPSHASLAYRARVDAACAARADYYNWLYSPTPVAVAPVPVWEVDLGDLNAGTPNWQPIRPIGGPSIEELSTINEATRPDFTIGRFGRYYLRAGGFGQPGMGYPDAQWHQVAKDDADQGLSFYHPDNARMRRVRRTLQ